MDVNGVGAVGVATVVVAVERAYLEKIPETEDTGIWTSGDFIYEKDDSDRWYHLKFYGFFEEYYWHNERNLWEYEED